MLLKMLTTVAGPEYSAAAGKEIEVDSKTANAWIEAGFAIPVKGKTPRNLETKTIVQPELGVLRASRQAIAAAAKGKLDLSQVTGSGRDGRITITDVRKHLEAAK